MKDIKNYTADKYGNNGAGNKEFTKIETGIYEKKEGKRSLFVTSISFVQEPEYGEGKTAENISQYPLEDILDKFFCHISDFYEKLNTKGSRTCYLEFASDDKNDIVKLRKIIGKHVYNREVGDKVELVIE